MTCPSPEATMNLSLFSIKCTGHHLCKSEKPSEERKVWYEEFTCTKKRVEVGYGTVGKVGKKQGIFCTVDSFIHQLHWLGLRPRQEFLRRRGASIHKRFTARGWKLDPKAIKYYAMLHSSPYSSNVSSASRSASLQDFIFHLLLWRQASNH